MSRNLNLYLTDILNSIDKIERYVGEMSQQELTQNEQAYEAVVFNLQIIGEAAKSIPEDRRKLYPQVSWKKVVGLRNIIVHTYFALSEDVIWDIIQTKLSGLKECVSLMKNEEEK